MVTIKCPKCKGEINVDISTAIDENGEVFRCPNCGYEVRFVDK